MFPSKIPPFATLIGKFRTLPPHAAHRKAGQLAHNKRESFLNSLPSVIEREEKRSPINVGPWKIHERIFGTRTCHITEFFCTGAPCEAKMCVYLCAKERRGADKARIPCSHPHTSHAHGTCNTHVHFLSQLVPYSLSAGSCLAQWAHPSPPVFVGLLALCHPLPLFGDFIYYLWGSVLFGDSGFYFSTSFDRYSGRWRGGSIWFCFMIRCGGSALFSEASRPGAPCKGKGNGDGL